MPSVVFQKKALMQTPKKIRLQTPKKIRLAWQL